MHCTTLLLGSMPVSMPLEDIVPLQEWSAEQAVGRY